MNKPHEPLQARVKAIPMPLAERELARAWMTQADAFAALVEGIAKALRSLMPGRSAQRSRSSDRRPSA
jgi:hypothetical protein